MFVFFALRVDALLELSCYKMTLWDKLGGSILLDSILAEIEFFLEIFCYATKNKQLLLWPVPRSIVEDFRGSSVRFSKPAKLVWFTLPMTVCVDQLLGSLRYGDYRLRTTAGRALSFVCSTGLSRANIKR